MTSIHRKTTIVLLLGILALIAASPAMAQAAPFGIESATGSLNGPNGKPLLTAGAHPDLDVAITFDKTETSSGGEMPNGNPKDVEVMLPPGLVGNPTATDKCTQGEIYELKYFANCEPNTQVGVATVTSYIGGFPSPNRLPVYNMVPPKGVAGQFAFNLLSDVVFINSEVTANGEYRLRSNIGNISQTLPLGDTELMLWGVPGAASHDAERWPRGGFAPGEPLPFSGPKVPLMTNPTSCTGTPLHFEVRADSWQAPGVFSEMGFDSDAAGTPLTIEDCPASPFEASLEAQPTTGRADSPSGLRVDVRLPQNKLPEARSAANLRDAVVTLPEGMAINPASAGGLGACSPEQIDLGSDTPPTCPQEAKIGSVRLKTPLLEDALEGEVYLAQQRRNKFGSLLALYLVVDDPTTGVLLKIPGKVETDSRDGRLVADFDEDPQLPFEELQIDIKGGPRAPLVTPPACGAYSTKGEFKPWSGGATITASDTFKIDSGPDGGACPTGGFSAALAAGTANPAAGRYSPFELRISRPDGTSRLSAVSVKLPKGLLGRLAGIPYCSDAALASVPTGEGTGTAQLASPSCPAASRVGSVTVSAGAGQSPFCVKTGSAYLAGPYKSAPLSLAIVTPAVAGPFDLGNVVVRAALNVNRETAQVTADSDPLPTILAGIPLDLREVRVTLDRSEFMLNPTSCGTQRVESTLTGVGGATASPGVPFTAASCAGLDFSPKLTLALKGGTRRGAYPRLTARLKARPGQANLARVAVQLPHTEFLAQGHIRTVCTRVQFAADGCPKNSIYGYAEARTPLLDQPLKGPVYLRSSSHKLPDLVAALRGQINIDLDGRIDSHHRGIRTTFATVPDAPISSFVLRMKGGKKSLLENSTSLCGKKAGKARIAMVGQNGAKRHTSPALRARCKRKHKR